MKKTLLSLSILILISKFSFGQDTAKVKYTIMTLPTQYLLWDFPLTVEKVFDRHTLGLTISYRPSTESSGVTPGGKGSMSGYELYNAFNNLYNAVTFGLNSKYFLTKRKRSFVEAYLYYRHWWFNTKYASNDSDRYWFEGIRTERQNIVGLKLLLGKRFQLATKRKTKPVMDLYGGLGLGYKAYQFETFNGTIEDQFYAYKKETNRYFIPLLSLGVKIGIGR